MIDGLILENTFTSIPRLIKARLPSFLAPLIDLMITMEWDSYAKISDIDLPMFFTTGNQDVIVPAHVSHMLYERAERSIHKVMYVEEKGGHFDTWLLDLERYLEELNGFMTRAREKRGQTGLSAGVKQSERTSEKSDG